MSRFKWFKASWPVSLRDIAEYLRLNSFKEGNSDGFVIDRSYDDLIEGRYIERFEVDDKTIDPFGELLQFSRIEFRQAQFTIFNNDPKLEFKNQARSPLVLINRISEATGFQMTIEPYNVNVLDWINLFEIRSGLKGFIDVMQIGSIDLGRSISARTMIKGKEDVREAAMNIIKDRDYIIEKAQFKFLGARKGSVTFSNTGGAIIKSNGDDQVTGFVRSTLDDVSS